jgi:hypothetical protein
MTYPKRAIANPTRILSGEQDCSWDPSHKSKSRLYATLSDDDETVQLSIAETKADGSYTGQAAIVLRRSEALDLLKVLAAVI